MRAAHARHCRARAERPAMDGRAGRIPPGTVRAGRCAERSALWRSDTDAMANSSASGAVRSTAGTSLDASSEPDNRTSIHAMSTTLQRRRFRFARPREGISRPRNDEIPLWGLAWSQFRFMSASLGIVVRGSVQKNARLRDGGGLGCLAKATWHRAITRQMIAPNTRWCAITLDSAPCS